MANRQTTIPLVDINSDNSLEPHERRNGDRKNWEVQTKEYGRCKTIKQFTTVVSFKKFFLSDLFFNDTLVFFSLAYVKCFEHPYININNFCTKNRNGSIAAENILIDSLENVIMICTSSVDFEP